MWFLIPLIGAGISVGVGGLVRSLMGDKNPWEPHEVALDAALGAIGGGVYGVASAGLRSAAVSAAETTVGRIAIGAASGAIGAAAADVSEDYLKPAIYSSELAPKEVREKWKNVKPKFKPEELLYSVPLGAAGGALIEAGAIAVSRGKIPVPKFGRVKPTEQESWTGIYIEKGESAKPVLGIYKQAGKRGIHIGDFEFKTISKIPKTGIELKSPIETKLLKNAIINYFKEHPYNPALGINPRTGLPSAYAQMKIIYAQENPPIRYSLREVLKQSERLRDVADDITDFAIKNRATTIVYGSQAQKMYGVGGRQAHDIDMVVKNAEKKAKELLNILKQKLGNNVRISPQYPTLIERRINGRWVHLIDLHEKGSLLDYLFNPQNEKYIGLGFRPQQPVKSQEGFYVMRLTEQYIRKGASSLKTIYPEGARPELHRLKDIYDFEEITKFMIKYLKNIGKIAEAKQLENLLKQFQKSISPELRAKILVAVGKTAEREGLVFVPAGKPSTYITPRNIIYAIAAKYKIPLDSVSKYEISKSEKSKPTTSDTSGKISEEKSEYASGYPSKPISEIPSIPSKPASPSGIPSTSDIYPSSPSISYPSIPSGSGSVIPSSAGINTRIPASISMFPFASFKGAGRNINQNIQYNTKWVPEF